MDQHAPPPRLHTGSVRFMKGPDGKHSRVQRIDAKDLDLNLLVMAKQEYTSFLHSILRDKVKGGLLTQYNTAVDEAPSPNLVIKTYQKILKETPLWNQNIVKKETERILGEYRPMFPNLIALIYVAKVKIMASVRVTKGTSWFAGPLSRSHRSRRIRIATCSRASVRRVVESGWSISMAARACE